MFIIWFTSSVYADFGCNLDQPNPKCTIFFESCEYHAKKTNAWQKNLINFQLVIQWIECSTLGWTAHSKLTVKFLSMATVWWTRHCMTAHWTTLLDLLLVWKWDSNFRRNLDCKFCHLEILISRQTMMVKSSKHTIAAKFLFQMLRNECPIKSIVWKFISWSFCAHIVYHTVQLMQ